MYLQTILKRDNDELVKRIFSAQKCEPCPGDFINLIKKDFAAIKEEYNEERVLQMSKGEYKQYVKSKIKDASMEYLKQLQGKHTKINHIKYDELKTQEYMLSPLFSNEEVSLLHCLRARYIECKANFSHRYRNDDLLCTLCKCGINEQRHIIQCSILHDKLRTRDVADTNIVYDDIFAEDVKKQKSVTALFKDLLSIRTDLLQKQDPSSSSTVELRRSNDLQPCIVYSSFGK